MEPGSLVASGVLRARGDCLRPPCRNFARGSCRWGQNCRFSHDRKSVQICRYFQSGFCSYGECCSYQHIQDDPVPVGTRHGPVPPGRWGSQPGSVPTAGGGGWGVARRSSAHPVPSVRHVPFKLPSAEVKEKEKDKNISAPDSAPRGAISREFVPAGAQGASGSQPQGLGLDPNSSDPREAVVETVTRTDPAKVTMEPGAAAALVPTAVLRARSEAVVCGICMDRVYEKPLPEERLFGILPNCSHAYCVGCIRKWRRSRDFQSMVIKACPECRITSSYYIPNKYWVSDAEEKEKLIKTFKARTGKIRCKFFVQNSGHCPFKSDCIYLHEVPARQPLQRRQRWPRMPAVFSPSPSESSDEDEELCVLEWALTLALTETDVLLELRP
ncbi:probable E3 ubiquitin-protein ligase makorin-1 [Falco rusticolus]|uniref:probable E3 ubiquitin-protein ligase makorin-1 n=1 Tax=Falco cherrug TaxID=345164 RepID=UPI000FFB97BA|nr:probable E3 ubiquitin-protein ligase makorin-1 [Falco cherrug]XP_037266209.1 probable E3 ubiquitin-protein ligase makorin-1 [Falco rusticolus]